MEPTMEQTLYTSRFHLRFALENGFGLRFFNRSINFQFAMISSLQSPARTTILSVLLTILISMAALALSSNAEGYTSSTKQEGPGSRYRKETKLWASIPVVNETEYVESQLDWFIRYSRSFLNDTSFYYIDFQGRSEQLKNYLINYATLVSMIGPSSRQLSEKLIFSEEMFRTMNDGAELMSFYKLGKETAHTWIHILAQFNVVLLRWYNSYGAPDPSIEGYSKVVPLLSSTLDEWQKSFASIPNMQPSLKVAFADQFRQAQMTSHSLEKVILRQPWKDR